MNTNHPNRWVIAGAGVVMHGGGFGTMPAFRADFFGPRNVGSIYGLMLTAWSFAALVGPTLIAHVRQSTGYYTEALDLIGGTMLLSTVLPFLVRPPNRSTQIPAGLLQSMHRPALFEAEPKQVV